MPGLGKTLTASAFTLFLATNVNAAVLVQYDPTGPQDAATALAAGTNLLNASTLTETGLPGSNQTGISTNTNVLPVGQLPTSTSIDTSQYLSFAISGTATLTDIVYDGQSYLDHGPLKGVLRSSADNFASDLATATGLTGTGAQTATFDFNDIALNGPLTFRLYFFNASGDWFDVRSTAVGGNGLVLNGTMDTAPVPVPAAAWLLGSGLAGLLTRGRKKI